MSDTSKTVAWKQNVIVNWSLTERSSCHIFKASDVAEVTRALMTARAHGQSIIAHGSGHSYTDAALNTNGVIIDVTAMRRILFWDRTRGIMRVEPGVTLRDVVDVALPDRWWPAVTPSTADATVGGCVAMNVNGKNAWKHGSFGEHVLSLTVLLADGQELALSPECNPELFHAFVGSAGLLGIMTSVTLQLLRVPSPRVDVAMLPAASLSEIISLFRDEEAADYMEAWVDGFAGGSSPGRGIVTSMRYSDMDDFDGVPPHRSWIQEPFKVRSARLAGKIGRPAVNSGVRAANSAVYWWSRWWGRKVIWQRSLFESTYYSSAVLQGCRAFFPHGTETFQAFVPRERAEALFKAIIQCSRENHFMPLWCIIKQHRQDPFLLSYQVDGFSLEVNYQVVPSTVRNLRAMLQELMKLVIKAGGRFYLAKDSLLTNALYRQSVGDAAVEAFLQLKQRYDPEMLFQSNLYRRVFQTPFAVK